MAPFVLGAAIGAALLAAAAARRVSARRAEAECAARLPVDADGIVRGARGFALGPPRAEAPAATPRPAILLLHGFGDTPQALRGLAEHLAAAGWRVRAPLLPGHGRTLRAFAASRADDWIAAARAELAALRGEGSVALCGLSMGGALATLLAAETTGVEALVLLAPYLAVPDSVRRVARVHHAAGLVTTYVRSRGERSIHDPVERERAIGYGWVTPRLLGELARVVERARAAAPDVVAPTLVVQSREDNRVPVRAAEQAFALIGAREKRLVWTDAGGHVITVDHGRERVWALTAEWLARHAAPVAPASSPLAPRERPSSIGRE